MTGYIYSIIKGKEYLTGLEGDMSVNTSIFNRSVNIKSELTLLDLNVDSILGEKIYDENNYCELPVFEEIKESPNFKVNDKKDIIKATITDDNNKVIKEIEFETGSKKSKKILLTSSGYYNISIKSGDFEGMFKVDIEDYKIF